MDIVNIILSAAKMVGVSGSLLVALCSHESANFTKNYVPYDNGSPSYGSCQLKYFTVLQLGFHGLPMDLMSPKVNAKYAALYLKYQQDRYGQDWVKLASAYNAGSYFESRKNPGCPINWNYVKKVKEKLPLDLQNRLQCGRNWELAEEG
jgi:soluble lytic murein transglycosylase-like protein